MQAGSCDGVDGESEVKLTLRRNAVGLEMSTNHAKKLAHMIGWCLAGVCTLHHFIESRRG